MSAEIVNLNKFRKARDKVAHDQAAEENRVRFGRTKSEKRSDEQSRKQAEKHLDETALTDKDPSND